MVVSIVGKNGQSVLLDPRRIKVLGHPVLGNPRFNDNPGFSDASLRKLGQEIKVVGQMEDVMVCPIGDDPDFDAQLIDGGRRQASGLLERFMVWATVREDVTPEMAREMYLMSVIRNRQKEPHTIREEIKMVAILRGPEYGMTIAEVAKTMGTSISSVAKLQMLGNLHPDVQKMIDDDSRAEGRRTGAERKLTSSVALLLYDIAPESQCTTAEEIISKQMNLDKARRHVLNLRRNLGLRESPSGRKRHAEHSQALATLVRNSFERFGVYSDMPTVDLEAMLGAYMLGARKGVYEDLLSFAAQITELAQRVRPKGE